MTYRHAITGILLSPLAQTAEHPLANNSDCLALSKDLPFALKPAGKAPAPPQRQAEKEHAYG